MNVISGFGLRVNIRASNTFPTGFNVTQFADDSDPFDLPSVTVAETAMGLNGDMVTWSSATPLAITLAVIPGSDDDKNLAILLEANRASQGKTPARDEITITGIYPDGSVITLSQGVITSGIPGDSIASSGRKKSKIYGFTFQSKSGVNL